EPSYNQNYDDNYYPHESPSFPCYDNCGGAHETFQCQPMDQNVDFSGSDQIQTPQYPEIHPPSQEIIAPILSTKEPEYSPSMGYEHLNTTPETEADEIIKSGVEELVPILSENEVTSEDKRNCDVPVCENSPICDDHSEILSDSNNDDDFEDIEYVEASLPDLEIVRVEEENVVHQEEEENDISDDSTNDPLLEEADLFLASDNSIPPGIENFAYDSEGDIRFLEALLINDSIPFFVNESSVSDFDNPSVPRPPPEPPDAEFDFELGE
nr:hypothetical protein [Tanacetum cinerariifolium]